MKPGYLCPKGYKQTEVGVIPEEWEVKLLPDICRFRGGKAHEQHISDTGQYVCVNSKFISTEGKVRKYSTANFCAAKRDDVLMVMSDLPNGRALAKAYLIEANDLYAVNQRVCALTAYRDCPKYLFYVLNRNPYFLKFDDGVGQTHLLNHVFEKCQLPRPPLPEQRAIAQALRDVDALLTSLARLIAKKRDLKQAAMQQLLTGQTRLPGFKGEWVETTLGEVATFTSGGTPSRNNDEYWNGEIPWISATSLRCFEIWRSPSNVTEEAVAAGSKIAPIDSTLLLVRGSALHNEILCGLVTKRVCFNQDVKALIPNSKVFPRFLTWLITGRADDFLKLVSSAGNTAGVLDTKLLKAFEFLLPDPAEQTAIAAVLTEMDAELAVLEQRQAKTRALKQGMMQELLTGRTRLPGNAEPQLGASMKSK
jgi:type I restriction enzyme S subunit